MKKTIKILSIMLIAVMLVMLVSTTANATTVNTVLEGILNGDNSVENAGGITTVAQTIIGIVNIVAVVVAVVILLVLGIKYMMGSASEKAEYKKSMIPYLIGAFIIFAAPTLVNIIVSLAGNFKNPQ